MEILIGLHHDDSRGGVVSIALLAEGAHEERHEEEDEGNGAAHEAHTAARADVLVVDIVHHI